METRKQTYECPYVEVIELQTEDSILLAASNENYDQENW